MSVEPTPLPDPSDPRELLAKLRALEERIESLERRQAGAPLPVTEKARRLREMRPSPDVTQDDRSTVAPPSHSPPPLPVLKVAAIPSPAPPVPDQTSTNAESDGAPEPSVLPYRQKVSTPSLARGSIEQTIGLKWTGWVGAIVLVIGAGLGIKFAYDQGWLGGMPAEGKLVVLWLIGFGLIGTGEYVYRRVNRTSAAGLFGAGVAMLFLVSYAGHGYFELYARQTAFVLMFVSTLVGAGVAMRGRLVSVGVLSLIGGHLAPVILGGKVESLTPFLLYLAALQGVALVLAWWGGTARWWTLRTFALAATSLWITLILSTSDERANEQTNTQLVFLIVFAAMFNLELVASAFKSFVPALAEPEVPSAGKGRGASAVVFSLIVTTLLTVALLVVREDASQQIRGLWVVGLAVAHSLLGLLPTLASGKSGAKPARPAVYNLAVGYRVQGAMLLIVAVPVALSGMSVLIGWAMMSVAFGVIGARLDLSIARRGAAVTWLLGVGYLACWYHGYVRSAGPADVAWASLFGQTLPAYWVAAAGLTVIGHAVALLLTSGTRGTTLVKTILEMSRLRVVVGALSGALLIVASMQALSPAVATFVMGVYAWLLLGADFAFPKRRLAWQAAVVVVFAIVKWACIDCLADRLSAQWTPVSQAVLINPTMGVGVFLSITLVAVGWLRRAEFLRVLPRPTESADDLRRTLAGVVIVVLTFGLTFEVDRQFEATVGQTAARSVWQLKQLAWTMLWSTSLAAMLGTTRWLGGRSAKVVRSCQMIGTVALLLGLKFLIVDTVAFRLLDGVSSMALVTNLRRVTAGALVGLMLLTRQMTRGPDAPRSSVPGLAGFISMLTGLWLVSFEIDRVADVQTLAAPWIFRQVGWSVCWSIFALLCVGLGFVVRQAALRYFGLFLFGLTLLKVVVIDLSAASTGYRILSFLGLGALLLGTSVLYGKVSPVLLETGAKPEPQNPSE